MRLTRGIRLFVSPQSPHARIVRMAVFEKGLAVALAAAASPDPAPRLVTQDGTVLHETTPILLHLDAVIPHPALLPLDGTDSWRGVAAYGRAIDLLDAAVACDRQAREPADTVAAATLAQATQHTVGLVDAIDRAVAAGWYAGGAAGWPDAAWIALAVALADGARRVLAGDWLAGRPALAAWMEAAAARPSFVATEEPPPG